MPVVQSFGAVSAVRAPRGSGRVATTPYSTSLDTPSFATYAALYRTQPEVRTVIEFLARNVAQVPLHMFRRVSDTDRPRLSGHEMVDWLEHPNPATSYYKLIDALMQDLGIYWTATWLKVRLADRLGLVRLPPETVDAQGWLLPNGFIWTRPDGVERELAPRDVVYFCGYNPLNPIAPLSPLETLRRTLAEERAAQDYREAFFRNSARLEGVIERPLAAPRWNPTQKQEWREQWAQRFVGAGKGGQVAVLEDGMQFKPAAHSARDSEFSAVRKLNREEVCRAYHIPPPMVGILDHATFSNIKEQHKQLYQDTLGPWLRFLQGEFERQLLPECDDQDNVYSEFNIAEKLKGSFEEMATSLQALCGRPIMTGNEGRARLNLPSMKDDPTMDEVVFSLNTSSPNEPGREPGQIEDGGPKKATPDPKEAETAALEALYG